MLNVVILDAIGTLLFYPDEFLQSTGIQRTVASVRPSP